MTFFQILLVGLLCLGTAAQAAMISTHPGVDSRVTGKLEFHEFKSKIFNNTRTLRVLLPEDYHKKPGKRYPVLYMNDGQDLFDAAAALYRRMEWGVDESISRLVKNREIEPLIIVGIDNAGKQWRAYEYLPWEDTYLTPPCPNPRGTKYPDFLVDEVIPFINRRFRTKTGPEYTGLGGASYGGLIALYTAIHKPRAFGYLLIESPSLYVADQAVLREAEAVTQWPSRVYLGVGTNEEGRKNCNGKDLSSEAVQDVFKLERILRQAGLTEGSLMVKVEPCATHNEHAFGKRFPDAMRFLFSTSPKIKNSNK